MNSMVLLNLVIALELVSADKLEVKVPKLLPLTFRAVEIFTDLKHKSKTCNVSSSPDNIVSPSSVRSLHGKCYTYSDKVKYIYEVCPFAGITQYEDNPIHQSRLGQVFSLGHWAGWHVQDNQFKSMIYNNGDNCTNQRQRQTYVELVCQKMNSLQLVRLAKVSEIKTCTYNAQLISPLFCDMETVYSQLDAAGQREWNLIETLLKEKQITEEGYEIFVKQLLSKHRVLPSDVSDQIVEEMIDSKDNIDALWKQAQTIETLDECRSKLVHSQFENIKLKEKLKQKE